MKNDPLLKPLYILQGNPSLKNLEKSKELFEVDDDIVTRFVSLIVESKSDNLLTK